VLQCVAVYYNVLQCVMVGLSVKTEKHGRFNKDSSVCCSDLLCVAVLQGVLQCVVV